MKQIAEDYVSFETAQLLKEKGFDIPVQRVYNNKGSICETYCDYSNTYKHHDWLYPCASQSLALKWLREAHKIIISFNASFVNSIEPHFSWNIRINSLKSLNDEEHFEPIYINVKSESFEESCEAAILYVLKNLI